MAFSLARTRMGTAGVARPRTGAASSRSVLRPVKVAEAQTLQLQEVAAEPQNVQVVEVGEPQELVFAQTAQAEAVPTELVFSAPAAAAPQAAVAAREEELEEVLFIRMTNVLDGAKSLDEATDNVQGFIHFLQSQKAKGWEVTGPVRDNGMLLTRRR